MAFSDEENQFIFDLYTLCNKSTGLAQKIASEEFKCTVSENTIRKKWKEENLLLNSHGGARNFKKRNPKKVQRKNKYGFDDKYNIVNDGKIPIRHDYSS